jgi:hypothetical protein
MKKWLIFSLLKVIELSLIIFIPYWIGQFVFIDETIKTTIFALWFMGFLIVCLLVGVIMLLSVGIGFLIELNLKWSKKLGGKK